MTFEEFEKEMREDIPYSMMIGRGIVSGLLILQKYDPNVDISAANHDVVYSSVSVDLISSAISVEDVQQLRRMGWCIDEDSIAYFL